MGPRSGANNSKSFTFAEVGAITRNFKDEIGKGGFGPVYYGVLPDGTKVAVKVNDDYSSTQGEREFFNEVCSSLWGVPCIASQCTFDKKLCTSVIYKI